MKKNYDFGLIGLGTMGHSFVLNMVEHGSRVIGFDNDPNKVNNLNETSFSSDQIKATSDIEVFIASLTIPRKIILFIPAGPPVDAVIEEIAPLLQAGDILMDGGNSYFRDTDNRQEKLAHKGINFLGVGISGGAEGALLGPSMMAGGVKEAYEQMQPVLQKLAARYDGYPCVAYLGPGSAGHYVKMVHNGIEYGLMQLISESYGLLKHIGKYSNSELQAIYNDWNTGPLQSYLIEITTNILGEPDPLAEGTLLDQVLDKAKQKGTGKWTSQNAMDLGIAVPTIDAAVRMREISAMKDLRVKAQDIYGKSEGSHGEEFMNMVHAALYLGYIVTFAQGFHLMSEASKSYSYSLDLATVSRIWRSGCIIRAALLQDITLVFSADEPPENLLLAAGFATIIKDVVPQTRELIRLAINEGIPVPAIYSALAYFDSFSTAELPINMIQAQRDYFGYHTYERKDRPGSFTTDWKGRIASKN